MVTSKSSTEAVKSRYLRLICQRFMSGTSLGRKTIWLDKLTCFEKKTAVLTTWAQPSQTLVFTYTLNATRVGLRLVHSILGRRQRHLNGDLSIVKGALTSASRGNMLFLTFKKRPDRKPEKLRPVLRSSTLLSY